MVNNWKIIAIVFIVLFILETIYLSWAVIYVVKEESNTKECYYEICGDYQDAYYFEKVCTCYNYDDADELYIAKEKFMK